MTDQKLSTPEDLPTPDLPVNSENTPRDKTIKRWRSRGLNLLVQHSEVSLTKLREELASKLEQVTIAINLKAESHDASEICQVLSENKEKLERELGELRPSVMYAKIIIRKYESRAIRGGECGVAVE
ncbi:hypothetical protein BpHYR1_009161 [Brachionus plicatilis]|uniref:Uncharacterized protein n=1 Tax=Brachionus plicatilis TaxID=10195 RepID=A0A3M7PFS3_BRAPC|nr:hypothetical protein BpHYR1_009161 [Brachionus plicatilis]